MRWLLTGHVSFHLEGYYLQAQRQMNMSSFTFLIQVCTFFRTDCTIESADECTGRITFPDPIPKLHPRHSGSHNNLHPQSEHARIADLERRLSKSLAAQTGRDRRNAQLTDQLAQKSGVKSSSAKAEKSGAQNTNTAGPVNTDEGRDTRGIMQRMRAWPWKRK